MLKRQAASIAFAILLAAFLAGVWQMFNLRTEQGDMYPPYSTFRADPVGTKALYQSLERLGELRVSRNYAALDKLKGAGETLFVLGVAPVKFLDSSKEALNTLTDLAAQGNRIVISFQNLSKEDKFHGSGETGHAWSFKAGVDEGKSAPSRSLYFEHPGPEWQPIVSSVGKTRIMARAFGRGSITLCADSYLFSNEAILKDRQTRLIAQLVGDSRVILFDESHNGMQQDSSIGTLIRRYRLQGFIVSLLVLAALFIWRNSSRFLPMLPEDDRLDSVSGKDSSSGLVKLLTRSVPASQLAAVCLAEWKKSPQLQEHCGETKLKRIEAVARQQNGAVATYRAIQAILAERN